MHRVESKRRAEMGVHIGSASIVMIFAVLCLTIFATLSFQTASYEQKLAQKTAVTAEAYYMADSKAEEIYQMICSALKTGTDYTQLSELHKDVDLKIAQLGKETLLYYAVPIDDKQELQIVLSFNSDGVLRTVQWNAVATTRWEYDDTIRVWDGYAFDGIVID